MREARITSEEIYFEAARIISLPLCFRQIVLADIWYLSFSRSRFLNNSNILEYIKSVEDQYPGWKREDFSILYYVITGEGLLEN